MASTPPLLFLPSSPPTFRSFLATTNLTTQWIKERGVISTWLDLGANVIELNRCGGEFAMGRNQQLPHQSNTHLLYFSREIGLIRHVTHPRLYWLFSAFKNPRPFASDHVTQHTGHPSLAIFNRACVPGRREREVSRLLHELRGR